MKERGQLKIYRLLDLIEILVREYNNKVSVGHGARNVCFLVQNWKVSYDTK